MQPGYGMASGVVYYDGRWGRAFPTCRSRRKSSIVAGRRHEPGKLEQFWACRKATSVIIRFCKAMETVPSPFASKGMGRSIGPAVVVAWPRLQRGAGNLLAELSY